MFFNMRGLPVKSQQKFYISVYFFDILSYLCGNDVAKPGIARSLQMFVGVSVLAF